MAQGDKTEVANNIYFLPRCVGPELIEYYNWLLREPLPQNIKDLVSMIAEAESGKLSTPDTRQPSAPRQRVPEKPE